MKNTILYWRGIFGDSETISRYKGTISKLAAREYKGLHLEKIGNYFGHSIYSVRVNREEGVAVNRGDRLLFRTAIINHVNYLLLLEVVLGHDYHRSKFLRQSAHYISDDCFAGELEALTEMSVIDGEEINYQPVDYFNRNFLIFNRTQENALSSSLPLIVAGAPGSGKSSMSFSMLINFLEQSEEPHQDILYLTSAEHLVKAIQDMFHEIQPDNNKVHFKTYQTLLKESYPDKVLVDKNDFKNWFKSYKRTLNKRKRACQQKERETSSLFDHADNELFYQEFRVLSAFTPEEYLKLGKRESNFSELEDREAIVTAYNSYIGYLGEETINPDFCRLPNTLSYKVAFVDEAQNLSWLQQKELKRIADNQICFFLDSHQSLCHEVSARNFIKSKLGITNELELSSSYRCGNPPIFS